jgi:hypothetical protein
MKEDDGAPVLALMVALVIIVGLFVVFILIPMTNLSNDIEKRSPTYKISVNNGTTTTEIVTPVPTYTTTTRIIINGDTTTTQILQWENKK